MIANI
jgi:hypothetical protein